MNQRADLPKPVRYDTLPPQNLAIEKEVLGACMMFDCDLDVVMSILKPGDFYRNTHQVIFGAIRDLWARKSPVDVSLVGEELLRKGHDEEEAYGIDALNRLVGSAPFALNAPHHACIIKDKATAREMIILCGEHAARAYEQNTASDDMVESLLRDSAKLAESGTRSRLVTGPEMVESFYARLAARHEKGDPLVKTGIPDLDDLIGGFEGGQLVIIAARTAMGKTSLATQIAENVAVDQGKGCIFFSLEMTQQELEDRIFGSMAQVDHYRIKNPARLNEEDQERLRAAATRIQESPLCADDTFVRGPAAIAAAARQYKAKNNGNLGAIVVDYLQLMTRDIDDKRASDRRHEYLAEITRHLKMTAKELNIPVIALAQLNRESESDKSNGYRPKLSSIRECGAIEQDANIVIFIHRPDKYDPDDKPGLAEIIVEKNRGGPIGSVDVQWKPEYTRFVPMPDRSPF
jgi:replicative DNA helicase